MEYICNEFKELIENPTSDSAVVTRVRFKLLKYKKFLLRRNCAGECIIMSLEVSPTGSTSIWILLLIIHWYFILFVRFEF